MGALRILRRGRDPDGGSWAEYVDEQGQECRIEVSSDLDVVEEIRKSQEEDAELRAEWDKLSPDEQERRIREWNETMASFDEKDGGGTSYAMAQSTPPNFTAPDEQC